MAELRSQDNGTLSQSLRRNPLPHFRALEAACHEIASEARPGYDKNGTSPVVCLPYYVGFGAVSSSIPSFLYS